MVVRFTMVVCLFGLMPVWSSAQGLEPSLVVDEGVQYFRDASYQEAIVLLSTVDRLFDASSASVSETDKTRAKFYLALSYAADGNTESARRTFRGLYEVDPGFEPSEQLPDPLVEMMAEERVDAVRTVCPEVACVDALAALRTGTFREGQIDPNCPCVDKAVDAGVKRAQQLLVARDYTGAMAYVAPLLKLRPDSGEARLVVDLARTACEVTQQALYEQWQGQFDRKQYAGARQTVTEARGHCRGHESALLQRITEQYRSALETQVERWLVACSSVDRPGRQRRSEYDAARAEIAALDDGQGINASALAATEDIRCTSRPCEFIVPYAVVEKPSTMPSAVSGVVTVSFQIDTEGRIVNPDDPAWFRVDGEHDDVVEPVRDFLEGWRFEPSDVPVCTVLSIDFH